MLLLFVISLLGDLVAGDFPRYSQPEQIHLSLGDNSRDIVVTWSTLNPLDDVQSYVEYGNDEFNNRAVADSKNFRDLGMHRCKLTNLEPNTTYKYRCGSKLGWSAVYTFKTYPDEIDRLVRVAIYGDLGESPSVSIANLQKEAQSGIYDAIMHIGDIAYEIDYMDVMKNFMRKLEPIAAYVPYLVSPGNHDSNANFSDYQERFTMPGGNNGIYYSVNIGPVHFVLFSVEMYYMIYEMPFINLNKDRVGLNGRYYYLHHLRWQYEWLVRDLEEATKPENRAQRPWIILLGHRPMYCAMADQDDCTNEMARVRVGVKLPESDEYLYGVEPLMNKYGVDIGFWGHEHMYERTFPVYNFNVYNGSVDAPYVNPGAPVHICTGAAGVYEDDNWDGRLPFSAFRSLDYSYTRFTIFNHSHAQLEQILIRRKGEDFLDEPEVMDKIILIKDKHGPYHIDDM